MEININDTLLFVIKVLVFLFGSGFLALFLLWPTNDEPTGLMRFMVYLFILAVVADFFFFGLITYT